jgi:hypothetical protein
MRVSITFNHKYMEPTVVTTNGSFVRVQTQNNPGRVLVKAKYVSVIDEVWMDTVLFF